MRVDDPQLAEHYVSEGWVIVEGLVSDEELDAVRNELPRFAHGDYPVANPADPPVVESVLAVHFPHWVSEIVADMVVHPGIASVLEKITGAHLPFWDGRVKCMQTMLFAKPPGLPGQAWHQDERYIPTRDRSLVGAWVALDDADEDNGCLRVLPQSHRSGRLYPLRDHGRSEDFDPGEEAFGFDETTGGGEAVVRAKAGDVVFFNGYLLHRSKRNATDDRYRRALVNHYCSAWSPLPWLVREGHDIGVADYRAIVPVVGEDPYPERGIEDAPGTVFLRPASGHYTDAQEIIGDDQQEDAEREGAHS
jgi:ectoine hydroxylase-related dioxygenase (phytanoyl-CoA dioxygenase family)